MPKINEATDTDLKVIEALQEIGWKRDDTLLYQPKSRLLPEQQSQFGGRKLAILDTYRLFGCDTGEPDYQFDLSYGIDEGFLAPYQVLSIETELTKTARETYVNFDHHFDPSVLNELQATFRI